MARAMEMGAPNMEKFTKQSTQDPDLNKVQDNLTRTLNPVFNTPILEGNLLQKIPLLTGSNTINHKLGRTLIGWMITRQRGAASIYDAQDLNSMPASTLILISSAPAIVDIYVF